MKLVQISFVLNDDLCMKSIVVDWNDTELPSDSNLIKSVAFAALKSLQLNKDDIMVQDLLNELRIKRELTTPEGGKTD